MKNTGVITLLGCLLICFHIAGAPTIAFAEEGANDLRIGAAGLFGTDRDDMGNYGGSLVSIEYERRLWRIIAAYAAIENIDYRYETGAYVENGHGLGGELGIRVYLFKKEAFKHWYLGGGWGYWSVKGNWKDDAGTPFVTRGAFRTTVGSFSLQTGYKWYFGPHGMFIDPRLQAGTLSGGGDSEAFGYASAFAAVRMTVGVSW